MKLLAIDPGGVHVGLAAFGDDGCQTAWELTPPTALLELRRQLMGGLDVLVIEEFRLYPWLAQTLSYSDFPTVQLIGAMKMLWATGGGEVWEEVGADPVCQLVMQPATIKDPTRNVLRGRQIKSVAKTSKAGGHAADAELHGWHYLLREEARKKDAQKKKRKTGKN